MKLIITESQYRRLIESEDDFKLYNFTKLYKSYKNDPELLDDIFLAKKDKDKINYDGYYIDGDVNIMDSPIKEFKYLVKINGHLRSRGSKIESLGKLEKVTHGVNLSNTKNLKSLGNLKYVGFNLDISDSNIEDLGHLNQVGRDLDLRNTKNLNSLGKISPEFSEEKFKIYVTDFLMIYGTGLSDEQIKKIKYAWLSKSPLGN